jgi:redox-sensitive bicupin YhaK (pirin superfamily)
VGPWCFLDSFGPIAFSSGKPMDVAPHPHIGLQTVSWLVEGEVHHRDSLGFEGTARPGVLNLMTAGRGIAHSEETPRENQGRLHGVQLWIALPEASRDVAPSFEQHSDLPVLELERGRATLLLGELSGLRSKAKSFSPLIATEVFADPGGTIVLPLNADFEHALVLLQGGGRLDGQAITTDTLYYLGCARRDLALVTDRQPLRALLLGGAQFGETILMWWNFVARTADEIASAREDWEAGRRFGEVTGYDGGRMAAPSFVPRSSSDPA